MPQAHETRPELRKRLEALFFRWILRPGHVLRHTFATSLVRGKTDLVVVAELMGHSRLDTTRQYSLPTEQDKAWRAEPPHHRPLR
jgi:site-specific recombinase XerD